MAQFDSSDFNNHFTGDVPDASLLLKESYSDRKLVCFGGYGRVLRAVNNKSQEIVAVKELLRTRLPIEGALAQLEKRPARNIVSVDEILREINCLVKVQNHNSFVQIKDFFYDQQYFYIIEEFIASGDLFDAIAIRKRYTESNARDVCVSLLHGIKHMHSLNIIHRDLKPENILVKIHENSNNYKICDFGLAQVSLKNQLTGNLGSVRYKAPEIFNLEFYGKPVDIWALGVIVYVIISGSDPFMRPGEDDRRDRTTIESRIREGVKFASPVWLETPLARDFVEHLLHPDASQRLTADEALQHEWITIGREMIENHELPEALITISSISSRRRAINVLRNTVMFCLKLKSKMRKRRINQNYDISESQV